MNATTMSRYEALVRDCSGKRVLVVGDVMLDRFIWGSVSRISPEAPVPVVNVDREAVYPGGAANVARNLVPFAQRVHIAGQAGTDAEGDILAKALADGGIDAGGLLRDSQYATITKTRIIAHQQQVVRFDRESIQPIPADPVVRVREFLSENAGALDGVILEDYGKGCITQELADAIIPVAQTAGLVITVDPNPNNRLDWKGVTAVKPNRWEAYREAGIPLPRRSVDPLNDETLIEVGRILLDRWGTEIVQITLGERGMMLFERGGAPHHIPTVARDVFDVSGAGDTAIALFTLALTAGATPVEAAEISNYASGIVVGKLGTATVTPEELLESMRRGVPDSPDSQREQARSARP